MSRLNKKARRAMAILLLSLLERDFYQEAYGRWQKWATGLAKHPKDGRLSDDQMREQLGLALAAAQPDTTTIDEFGNASPENAALLLAAREQLGECCERHANEPDPETIRWAHEALGRVRQYLLTSAAPDDLARDECRALCAAMYPLPKEEKP